MATEMAPSGYSIIHEDDFKSENSRCLSCDFRCDCCISCWKKYNTTIPLEENLKLTAIQKWRKYSRPPWKLILSLFIVICVTTQVILFTLYISAYVRDAKVAFQDLLAPPDSDISITQNGQNKVFHIYRTDSLHTSLSHISDTYFSQRNTSIDFYGYGDGSGNQNIPTPINLRVNRYSAGSQIFDTSVPFDNSQTTDVYSLSTKDDISRIWTSNLSTIVSSLREVEISFSLINYNLDSIAQTCYNWHITGRYTATTSGKVDLDFDLNPLICSDSQGGPDGETGFNAWASPAARKGFISLMVFIMAFCFLSQALYIKAVFHDITMLARRRTDATNPVTIISNTSTRTNPENAPVMFVDATASCTEKLKFVNAWFAIATVGNVLNFVHASYCLSRGVLASEDNSWLAVMGFGVMSAWLSMTQFFESTSTYYVLIQTLKNGLPRVGRFFLGIMPIFFAYAVFGVAYFSSFSHRFSNMDDACVTLFSLLNGDVIHDVFDDIHDNSPIVSRVYLYSFLALFIYAVLNIFVAIIEDSFFATKQIQDQEEAEQSGRKLSILELLDEREDPLSRNDKPERDPTNVGYYRQLSTRGELGDEKHDEKHEGVINEGYFESERSAASMKGSMRESKDTQKQDAAFRKFLEIMNDALSEDLRQEFSQVCLELKFPNRILRPPHEDGFYPCGFEDCLYCAVREELLKNLDMMETEVKVKIIELIELMKKAESKVWENVVESG